jgi:hypothetical protein
MLEPLTPPPFDPPIIVPTASPPNEAPPIARCWFAFTCEGVGADCCCWLPVIVLNDDPLVIVNPAPPAALLFPPTPTPPPPIEDVLPIVAPVVVVGKLLMLLCLPESFHALLPLPMSYGGIEEEVPDVVVCRRAFSCRAWTSLNSRRRSFHHLVSSVEVSLERVEDEPALELVAEE